MMCDSALDEECEEDYEAVVVPRYQSFISREDNESLLSTGRRLI
jgi:hypothetical protein